MQPDYKHTQFGALTILILLVTGALIAPIFLSILADGRLPVAIIMLGLYLFILALFYALTIEISEGKLEFWFGIGAIRYSYSLDSIQSSQEVKNPWYYL